MRRFVFALCATLAFVACPEQPVQDAGVPPEPTGDALEAMQQYELRGIVEEVDADAGTIKVDHEAIGDWMGAMTMSFDVRGIEADEMPAVGDVITATVNVEGADYWLTDVSAGGEALTDEAESEDDGAAGADSDQ